MGTLTPGATYIYEKADGITYAREFGTPHSERFEIGRDVGRKELDDHNEWIKIRLAAKKNPALQAAVERVIMLYHLSKKEHGQE
jgi:hypothetical protein